MKVALLIVWMVGALVYLVDVIQRVTGYAGWSPSPLDAIAIVAIAAALAVIWKMEA